MYKFIETGKRHPRMVDMVFGAIYCEAATPNRYYTGVPKERRGDKIPLVLMLLRWDGCIGFPGGKVDSGEDLETALKRELREEINFNVDLRKAKLLCSLATESNDRHIHCYEYNVGDESWFRHAITQAAQAEHFLSESQGCFGVQIAHFEGGGGIYDFLKNNFKATAKMELECLIRTKKWVPLGA
jgi:U8 snoRNA-decapping enzyme